MTQDRRVAVIGLGYVGLPLAIAFSEAGLEVEGIDAWPGRIAELLARTSPIDDVSDERLGAALDRGMRVVSPVDAAMSEADAIFVCVPTPITATKDPDLAPVLSAAETICGHVRKGQLIVLQSTTFPGTTTGPFAEVVERSGLKAGVDFDLAFAPERVNPGDPASASKGVPRLVGATTPQATKRAAALLRNINDQVVELSSPDAAELAKLLENVFRNINIAFVNQLALLCERMGLDVWEVINAAATKPFGFMKFTPGPASAGTASRSIRTTSRGAHASSTSATASSRRPATSTSRCRATSSTSSPRRSTTASARSRARRWASSAWPSSRMCRTPGTHRQRRCWRASPSAVPRCATTTRTSRRSATPSAPCARTCRSTSSWNGPTRSSS